MVEKKSIYWNKFYRVVVIIHLLGTTFENSQISNAIMNKCLIFFFFFLNLLIKRNVKISNLQN